MDQEWIVQVNDNSGNPVTTAQVALVPLSSATGDWPFSSVTATHAHTANGKYEASSPITPAEGAWILVVLVPGNPPTKFAPVTQGLTMSQAKNEWQTRPAAARYVNIGQGLGDRRSGVLARMRASTVSWADSVKTVAGTKKRITNITVTVFPVRNLVILTGTDFEDTGTSFRIFAENYIMGLRAKKLIDNGAIVTLLSCDDRTRERLVPAQGRGFVQVDKFSFGPDTGKTPGRMRTPVAGQDISIIDFYAYLNSVGQGDPGSVNEVGVFSHSWPGGPILFNTGGDDVHAPDRNPTDFDARRKDFNATNMASWPHLKDAMDSAGKWQIWGCSATRHINGLTAAAARLAKVKDADHALFTVTTSTNSRGSVAEEVTQRTDREHLRADLDGSFRTMSYMAQAASALGISVWGAPPGVGSNYGTLMFIDQTKNAASFAYYKDQFAPEFQPTNDSLNRGYVDYKALAARTPPTPPFASGIYTFGRRGDVWSSPPQPTSTLTFANGRTPIKMKGIHVRLAPPTSKAATPGFGTGLPGWLYELHDTVDPTIASAVFVQDDGTIFDVTQDPAGKFTVSGSEIVTDPPWPWP